MQPNHFGVFALPVGEFLGLLHGAVYVGTHAVDGDLSNAAPSSASGEAGQTHTSQFFAQREGKERAVPLVTCNPSATVEEVMRLMIQNCIHRVYVVDDQSQEGEHKPLALVTTTDVLRWLAAHTL